jgi:hypothetical protein
LHFFKKSPYFSGVNLHRHTIIQKITSSLLIALILFINAVKLFHTHPQSSQKLHVTRSFFAGINDHQQVSTNDRCAICAFNFVKDADITPLPVLALPTQQFNLIVSFKLPAFQSIHHSTNSGRAPPSLV